MLRRILSLTLSALLFLTPLAPAWGQMAGGHQLAAGTILASAAHFATVADGAFGWIDAVDLSVYVGSKITLRDSSNRTAVGYVMAASGGEALAANLFAAFDFTSGWNVGGGTVTINDANTFTQLAATGGIYKDSVYTTGALYKSSLASTESIGGTTRLTDSSLGQIYAADGDSGKYFTSPDHPAYLYNTSGGIGNVVDVTTLVSQRVTDGPVTGIKIASTKGGSTQSFAAITSGFDPNNITYYRVERTHAAVVVASSSPGAGVVKMATVATGALLEITGTNLSGFASTANHSYLVVLYSASGAALAYTGAVGGGETLGDEKNADVDFGGTAGWNIGSGWAIAGGTATATGATTELWRYDASVTDGWLLKGVVTLTGYTSGTLGMQLGNDYVIESYSGAGPYTGYRTTSLNSALGLRGNTALTAVVDSFSVKRVTDVPATALKLHNKSKLDVTGAQSLIGTTGTFDANSVTAEKRYLIGP